MKHLIRSVLIGLLALQATACASKEAISVSRASIDTQHALAAYQAASLNEFDRFVEQIESQYRELQEMLRLRDRQLEKVIEDVQSRTLRATYFEMLASFDERALDLLGAPADSAYNRLVWDRLNPRIAEIQAAAARAQAEYDAYPDDVAARVRATQLNLHETLIQALGQQQEVQFRKDILRRISQERAELAAEFEVMALRPGESESLASTLEGPEPGTPDEWDLMLEELDSTRKSIRQMGDEVAVLHAEQSRALEELHRYTNRPRAWELVFDGVKAEVSATINRISSSVTGQIGETVSSLAERADHAASDWVDRMQGSVDAAIDSVKDDLDSIADRHFEQSSAKLPSSGVSGSYQ